MDMHSRAQSRQCQEKDYISDEHKASQPVRYSKHGMALEEHIDTIRAHLETGATHEEVSERLKANFPHARGLGVESVRKFCGRRFPKPIVKEAALDAVVAEAVGRVGPYFGRKTLQGFLKSRGCFVGERRIGAALNRVCPVYAAARRCRAAVQTNPLPYRADYFGHRLHLDQNEKLVMYGVVHVAARDGYSGCVVGMTNMPVKNAISIYSDLFMPILRTHGLWDQVRVDCGREFALALAAQAALADHRTDVSRRAILQSTSTTNHIIERWWVEVNQRVNYPLKRELNSVAQTELVNMEDEDSRFFVSSVASALAGRATIHAMDSWNDHTIPGKGCPYELMQENYHTAHFDAALLPSTDELVQAFEASGGHLTYPTPFGKDPLAEVPFLQENRDAAFRQVAPELDLVWGQLVNGNPVPFRHCLHLFSELTYDIVDEF